MPRLSADQWGLVRAEWEGEPLASFNSLADKHGINVSNISRRAARDGWIKRNQLASINEAASRKADAMVDSDGQPVNANANAKLALAQRELSEDLRAQVQVRHRRDWAEMVAFRKTALAEMKTAHARGDKEAWQVAKLAADTALANLRSLAVAHDGERKAWGLDLKSEEEIIIANPRRLDS